MYCEKCKRPRIVYVGTRKFKCYQCEHEQQIIKKRRMTNVYPLADETAASYWYEREVKKQVDQEKRKMGLKGNGIGGINARA